MRHTAGEGYRILLVDDHPAIRQGVGLLLALGKHVICGAVPDVAEARRGLDQGNVDLVLLDLSLGTGSGLDLLAEVTARGLPAVVYSMHEVPETIERAFQAGAQGYVTKREDPEVLLEAVATVMAGRRFVSLQAVQILARQTLYPADASSGRELSERKARSSPVWAGARGALRSLRPWGSAPAPWRPTARALSRSLAFPV
jgi:DNA-binding NarL/FixJ family response regulator